MTRATSRDAKPVQPPELDFWHPVLKSEALRTKPKRIELCGQDIVLFRTERGIPGALPDRCPHRGMRLSLGRVERERLVCPYHGWAWAVDGSGLSPGNPTGCFRATPYDVREAHGAIWVKSAASRTVFPELPIDDHVLAGRVVRRVRAPLELVLDNFVEVEHTGSVHLFFGYESDRLGSVKCEVTQGDDWVRVYNEGPQRPMPWLLRRMLSQPDGALFVDDWTTRFAPIHAVYDQYWLHPVTKEKARNTMRNIVFFNPIREDLTELFVFVYSAEPRFGRLGYDALLRRFLAVMGTVEIHADVRAIESLADKSTSLQGRQLGRFDKGVIATRNRVQRIYRRGAAALAEMQS